MNKRPVAIGNMNTLLKHDTICDTGGRLSVRQEKDNWRELESRLNRLAVSKGQQKSVVDVSRRTNFHFFHKLFGSIYGALRYWISKNVVEFSERV